MEKLALAHILWLGGMSGVGKSTGARLVAHRHDLRLYSIDSYNYVHAARAEPERQPALCSYSTLSADELWLDPTPEEIADGFVAASRERLELIVEDLLGLPADAPILVDGPQLLPSLVAPLAGSPGQALFLVADPELQRRLVTGRGPGASSLTGDPARAHENRLRRDELLAGRVRREAAELGFAVVEIRHPAETETAIESHFRLALEAWLARGDRGDVAARRRDENDARLMQWRLHAERVPAAGEAELPFACECGTPGCAETVPLALARAEELKRESSRLVAH